LAGIKVRFDILPNAATGETVYALFPEVCAGCTVAVYNWSTIPHTTAGYACIEFPQNLNCTCGVAWRL
jgi:hypothetical protein